MSGRRREKLSPTLFPFLAVLVCTLGTLILLLALVAQNTSDAAQQIADAKAASTAAKVEAEDGPEQLTVGDVQLLVEEEEFRLTELVSFREAQTGDLEDRRNQLAHVEDHMRRIRERLQQISDAMEQAAEEHPTPATTDDELASLKTQLVQAESVVKKLRDEIKTAKPRFVIVPHQGPNGTDRRPIYLECTAKGVTIWPEGVAITQWQLEHSSSSANPLDDALRAARYYAMQEYGDKIPPYPMLLVRPDGVETYYAARSAMLDWDDQFGYELVPTDVSLAYPTPDPVMKQRMEYAINQAVNRVTQQSIARSVIGPGSRYPGLPSDPGAPGGYADRPTGGEGNGAGDSGNIYEGESGAGQGGTAVNRIAEASSPAVPQKFPRLSVSQMDQQGRRSGFRDHRMFPTPIYGSGGGQTAVTAEDAKRRLERQLEDSASTFSSVDAERALDQAATTAVDEIAGGSGESNDQTDGGSMWLNSAPGGTGNSESEMMADGNSDAGGGQRINSSATGSSTPSGFGSQGGGMTGIQQNQQPVSQQMQSQQQASSADGKNVASSSNLAQQPSSNSQRVPESLVQRTGVDWALPSSIALGQGNEIVRSIRIQVHMDRLVVLPSAGARISETFSVAEAGVNMATLQMATAVRNRIERWGAAAPGARWSPRLMVDVMPGAEKRFMELERLMTGSGLPIQRSVIQQADAGQQETVGSGDLR
ncbi:MAG: hypothetical protein KDB00_25710 [Planctomycetales bacterium]|nr:hypothetical protein [Planctomycetales bacterium]